MSRMAAVRRSLLNLFAALSLMLCVAVAVSWVASYRGAAVALSVGPDIALAAPVGHSRGNVRFVVWLGRRDVTGTAVIPFPPKRLGPGDASGWSLWGTARIPSPGGGVTVVQNPRLEETPAARRLRADRIDQFAPAVRFAGIAWQTGGRSGPVDSDSTPSASFRRWGALVVPHPYLLAAAVAFPAWRAVSSIRRRRRDRAGHCPRCGYDLRATPDRCPECGAASEAAR